MPGERDPWILGISASHNGAACLLRGPEIVAAVQEERLVRRKRFRLHGASPSLAVRYCLDRAGISARDVDRVVMAVQGRARSPEQDPALNPQLRAATQRTPALSISHHMAHAASAFATSGLSEAAVLVIDGMGSPEEDLSESERAVVRHPVQMGWEAISSYAAGPGGIVPLEKHLCADGAWLVRRPEGMSRFGTLGGMYSAVAEQIFGDPMEAGKVMGLAPYGRPSIPPADFFAVHDGSFAFFDRVPMRFSHQRRWPDLEPEYRALAASVQAALEEALLHVARRLRATSGLEDLCYAGGVALNGIANTRLLRESGFRRIHVIPAAEDSGPAVGAAYHGLFCLTGATRGRRLTCDGLGRVYDAREVASALARTPRVEVHRPDDLLDEVVDLLCDGNIGGWFQGGLELGPRALGQRSILCDPRRPEAQEIVNRRVKHREPFRPFAPAVLLSAAAEWFELDGADPESPFMLRVHRFKEAYRDRVPAVVHVDGTGRLQTVTREANGAFFDLIERFYRRTGVPILLNTSFNVAGEPIVETPDDALWCLLSTGLDFCAIEGSITRKAPGFRSILDLYPRLLASRVSLDLPIEGGRLDLDLPLRGSARFAVETPWGGAEQVVDVDVLRLLGLIDGATDGWTLLERLSAELVGPVDEPSLVRSLSFLRSASIIALGAGPEGGRDEARR